MRFAILKQSEVRNDSRRIYWSRYYNWYDDFCWCSPNHRTSQSKSKREGRMSLRILIYGLALIGVFIGFLHLSIGEIANAISAYSFAVLSCIWAEVYDIRNMKEVRP